MVTIASCSLATSPVTSIGLMPHAMLSRDSLFVARRFVQENLLIKRTIKQMALWEVLWLEQLPAAPFSYSYALLSSPFFFVENGQRNLKRSQLLRLTRTLCTTC